MTHAEAVKEARIILSDEANSLAILLNDPQIKDSPHRAKVAIQREIQRLRDIALHLDKRNEKTEEQP